MTPAAIIREAAADGMSLALSPAGTIKAAGESGGGESLVASSPRAQARHPGVRRRPTEAPRRA